MNTMPNGNSRRRLHFSRTEQRKKHANRSPSRKHKKFNNILRQLIWLTPLRHIVQCYDCHIEFFSFVVRRKGAWKEFFPFLMMETKHAVAFNDKQFSHSSTFSMSLMGLLIYDIWHSQNRALERLWTVGCWKETHALWHFQFPVNCWSNVAENRHRRQMFTEGKWEIRIMWNFRFTSSFFGQQK